MKIDFASLSLFEEEEEEYSFLRLKTTTATMARTFAFVRSKQKAFSRETLFRGAPVFPSSSSSSSSEGEKMRETTRQKV